MSIRFALRLPSRSRTIFPLLSSTSSARTSLATRPLSTTHQPLLFAAAQKPTENSHPQRAAQQDRSKMNVESNEYTKSGTDTSAANQDEAAFDPNITDPQEAKEKAGEGTEGNPLEVSPANKELSKGTEEGGKGKKSL